MIIQLGNCAQIPLHSGLGSQLRRASFPALIRTGNSASTVAADSSQTGKPGRDPGWVRRWRCTLPGRQAACTGPGCLA